MNLCTLMMLAATDTNGRLHRVQDMSYPEKQSYAWFKKDDLIPTEVRCNFQPKYNIFNFLICHIYVYTLYAFQFSGRRWQREGECITLSYFDGNRGYNNR